MRFWPAGRKRKPATVAEAPPEREPAPLTVVRVTGPHAARPQSLGRRDADFLLERVFVPSLIVDHTELVLRQAGTFGHEGFAVWAGTLAGGDGYVSSLVIPRASTGPAHGEISAGTTADTLAALDERDLVPLLQLHTHPRRAFLSETDAIRPLVAVPGFVSVVIPSFGYVDLADVSFWSAHEFLGRRGWRELTPDECKQRFVIDDSIIYVD